MKQGYICAIGLGGMSVFLSLDHFHANGETVQAQALFTEPGGKAYNQAVAVSRLAAPSMFIGAMGKDQNAESCCRFLDSEHVRHRVLKSETCPTAYACILTDSKGENRVTVYPGASKELSAEYIYSCRDWIAECSILLLGLECPLEATLAALEIAEAYGVYTILNPAPAIPLDLALLRRFSLITPNRQEAQVLLKLDSQETIDLICAFHKVGLSNVVITLGDEGAALIMDGIALHYPVLPCKPIDTTGAGDCFNAALAVALYEGKNLSDAVVFATNCATLSVTKPHVMTALPTIDEVGSSYKYIEPAYI